VGGLTSDRSLRLRWLAHSVKSNTRQIPQAAAAVAEACRVLDVSSVPEVFVAAGGDFNARVIGFETPFLVVGAGLFETLSSEELLAVVGHEIGHLKAGHTVYRTALWILTQLSLQAAQGGDLVRLPVLAALKDWERKSELSCDRAGLLACQDPAVALGALVKVHYRGLASHVDAEELLRQGAEWEASGDLLDSVFKVLGSWDDTHPAFVQRYAALHEWSRGDEYPRILAGTYRVSGPGTPADDLGRAWTQWKDDLHRSEDPGTKVVAEAVRQAATFFQGIWPR